jgi:Domain of unknown function (DUF4251)
MKKIIAIVQGGLFVALPTLFLHAQEKDPPVKQIVDEHNYIFKAESASSQQGRLRQLSSEYDLTVMPDTVVSYLPFFGRAYSAPIDPTEGGIKFTSTKFEYKLLKQKKDRWDILITPKDASDVQQLYLTIYDNGRATLRINSLNRQSMSFTGYVVKGREREKKGF